MPGRRPASSSGVRVAGPPPSGGTGYDRAAAALAPFVEAVEELPAGADLRAVLVEARARLDRFADELREARLPPASVAPARLAMALWIDAAARRNADLPRRDWSAAAHRLIFEGEAMSEARLRELQARAAGAGPAFADLARFLEGCLGRVAGSRQRPELEEPDSWAGLLWGAALGFAALVLAWMVYAEWSFHRATLAAFRDEAVAIGLDRSGPIPDLPARFDRMAEAVANVEASLADAPVRLFAGPLGFDAADVVRGVQAEAAARHLPPLLAGAIGEALASEGDPEELYDTLRAWNVLSGADPWNPSYLQGWLAARASLLPQLRRLVPHVALLRGPAAGLTPSDPEILDQARAFAAEAGEADRAWIELERSAAMAALPGWRPDLEVADLGYVMQRRSGLPLSTPIPGLFTAAGWDEAAGGAATEAVATARREAERLFPPGLPAEAGSVGRVLERLQVETLAAWSAWLSDLQVQSFGRKSRSLILSGFLARSESPLTELLRAVWAQAGGLDRTRPPGLQQRVLFEFGPMIQYVDGGRIRDISRLFAALNEALRTRDGGDDLRNERLLSFGQRAASVTALRQAPSVVVRLVEDVLAQVAVPREAQMANPFTQDWQGRVLDLCLRTTQGRFPFAEGEDADPAAVAALLGPGGAVESFFRTQAESYIDTSASPWRWTPEARFAGLSPDSAAFFERAAALGRGFFGGTGRLGTRVTLATLAEKGRTVISLGGATAPLDAGAEPVTLDWPGADPAAGIAVRLQSGGAESTLGQPGPWGLLRLLSGLRLRERDEGARFLVDLRADTGRIFLEMSFPSAANPVAALRLAEGFTCPAAL